MIWWFRSKWLVCKLTAIQVMNVYIRGEEISEKGLALYDYCAKVAFDNYEPVSFQDTMFEDIIQEDMKKYQLTERKHAAMITGGTLAHHMRPKVFWSDERPGKLIGG